MLFYDTIVSVHPAIQGAIISVKYELIALVKQMRQAAGLSIAEVANISKIDPGAISRFEAGKKFLAPAYFVRYIDACRITGSDRARAVKLYNQAQRSHMTGVDGQPAVVRFYPRTAGLYYR